MCRTYGARSLDLLRTQGFHPGLGVCRADGAGRDVKNRLDAGEYGNGQSCRENKCGVGALCAGERRRGGCGDAKSDGKEKVLDSGDGTE